MQQKVLNEWKYPLQLNPEFAGRVSAFLAKVEKQANGCWLWKAGTFKRKTLRKPCEINFCYGQFSLQEIGRRTIGAHVASYLLFVGALETDDFVRHSCDVSLCVSPYHLDKGSHQDNMNDMIRRGRSAAGDRNSMRLYPEKVLKGEKHGNSKYSDIQIKEVKHLLSLGVRQVEIARVTGVHKMTVNVISKGKQWSHLV